MSGIFKLKLKILHAYLHACLFTTFGVRLYDAKFFIVIKILILVDSLFKWKVCYFFFLIVNLLNNFVNGDAGFLGIIDWTNT